MNKETANCHIPENYDRSREADPAELGIARWKRVDVRRKIRNTLDWVDKIKPNLWKLPPEELAQRVLSDDLFVAHLIQVLWHLYPEEYVHSRHCWGYTAYHHKDLPMFLLIGDHLANLDTKIGSEHLEYCRTTDTSGIPRLVKFILDLRVHEKRADRAQLLRDIAFECQTYGRPPLFIRVEEGLRPEDDVFGQWYGYFLTGAECKEHLEALEAGGEILLTDASGPGEIGKVFTAEVCNLPFHWWREIAAIPKQSDTEAASEYREIRD